MTPRRLPALPARTADLRRPRPGTARRRPGRAAPRMARACRVLGRGGRPAARARAAHPRPRPARLLAGCPAAVPYVVPAAGARGRRRGAGQPPGQAGPPRRARLGSHRRVGPGRPPPRPGPQPDRGVGAAPGGVPDRVRARRPAAPVVVLLPVRAPVPGGVGGPEPAAAVRHLPAEGRHDPPGRGPGAPRGDRVRRPVRRARLVPRAAVRAVRVGRGRRSPSRRRTSGATATSRCRAPARRSAAGGSPVPTSSWCSRASATGSRPRLRSRWPTRSWRG